MATKPLASLAWVLGTVAATGVLVALIVLGSPFRLTEAGRFVPAAIIAAAGVAGWMAALLRPWPGLAIPAAGLGLLLTAQALSAVVSPHPSLAWPALWHQFAVLGTGLLAWRAARSAAARPRLLLVLAAVLVVVGIAYVAEVLAFLRYWLALGMPASAFPLRPGAAGGIAGIPTWMGDYLVLLAPVVAGAVWSPRRRSRVASGAILLVAGALLVLTGTRSLWLVSAAVAGAAVLIVVLRRPTPRRLAAVGAAVGVLAIAAVAVDLPARVARDADAGRSSAFGSALEIFGGAPLLGTGPGTYVVERMAQPIPFPSWYVFPSAHNLELNALAETGIVGALAALLAVLAVLSLVVRNLRTPGRDRATAVGAVAGVTLLALHAQVDVVLEVRGLAVLAMVVAGLAIWRPDLEADEAAVRASSLVTRRPRLATVAVATGCLSGVLAAVPAARSELAAAAMFESLAEPDAGRAATAAARALDLDPGLVPALSRAARLAAARGDLGEAERLLGLAADMEPPGQHEVELAVVRAARGDDAGAIDAMDRALSGDLSDPLLRLDALALFTERAPERVQGLLRELIELEPGLLPLLLSDDGGWAGPARAEVLAAADWVIRFKLSLGQERPALYIAAISGDDTMRTGVAAAIRDPFLRVVADALAGDSAAAGRVAAEALDAPLAADYPWWSWFLAWDRCDEPEAVRWAEIRRVITSARPTTPLRLVQAPTTFDPGSRPPGYPSGIWGVAPDPTGYGPGMWTWETGTPTCRTAG